MSFDPASKTSPSSLLWKKNGFLIKKSARSFGDGARLLDLGYLAACIINAGVLAGNPSLNIFLERDCSLDFASAGSLASEYGEMFMGFEKCAELGPLRSTWGLEGAVFGRSGG